MAFPERGFVTPKLGCGRIVVGDQAGGIGNVHRRWKGVQHLAEVAFTSQHRLAGAPQELGLGAVGSSRQIVSQGIVHGKFPPRMLIPPLIRARECSPRRPLDISHQIGSSLPLRNPIAKIDPPHHHSSVAPSRCIPDATQSSRMQDPAQAIVQRKSPPCEDCPM